MVPLHRKACRKPVSPPVSVHRKKPMHPYTRALLSAILSVDIHNPIKREILKGELTSPINPAPGCRFAARCKYATEKYR